MTREVVTVGPDTSAKYAAELMAGRGFAALPVVDDAGRLAGIVAEADVARLFVDEGLRSVPVLEHGRLAGIVSRRDLLAALVRPDTEIRHDLLRLVEGYTGDPGCWDVTVTEGIATIGRTRGTPEIPAQVEERAVRALAHTVAGVVSVRVLPGPAVQHVADRSEGRV